MRFSLKQTSARAFDLSLPDREGRARQLGFEHITDLGGAIEIIPEAIVLQEAAARLAQVTAVEWRAGSGLITIGAPVAVMDLFVDGRIPRGHDGAMPLDGRATVKRLGTDRLVLEGFGPRISTGLRLERVDVAQGASGGEASVEAVSLAELETALGDFLVRLREAGAAGIRARWPVASGGEGGPEVTVASVTGTGLAMRSRTLAVEAENIDVRDAAMRGGAFSVAAVSVGRLSLEIDLVALRASERADERADQRADEAGVSAPARPSVRSLIDWRLLDRVDGQIDVDVTVDAHLPVIRRRRATHYFRVPIEKGVFNYRQLESGLSSLENAVIDFDVRGHKLVIERDLPIIRMRKNLVEWHLDDEEMALARQRKVKLRTLPRFEIKTSNGKDSDVKLHGIEIHPINIDLSVAPPADAAGAPGDAAEASAPAGPGQGAQEYSGILPELTLRRLIATGSLDYPEGEGALTIKIKQLAAALRGLPLGPYVVDVGAIRVDAIEPIKIVFDGLVPRGISLTVHGLALERITVSPAAGRVDDRAAEAGQADAGVRAAGQAVATIAIDPGAIDPSGPGVPGPGAPADPAGGADPADQ